MSEMHSEATNAYFREQMLPAMDPPGSERGAVKWLRENLFSSWFNSILTVIGVMVVYLIVAGALPWFLNGVWVANSLQECRAIIEANAGPGAEGACWAMIRERWHQFIFGFYPPQFYWRPVLTLGLLFAALAPVLYADNKRACGTLVSSIAVLTLLALVALGTATLPLVVATLAFVALSVLAFTTPARLGWFSLIYPMLGYFLLWGGTIWGPVGVLVGFALIAVVFKALQPRLGVPVSAGLGLLAASFWWLWVQSAITTELARLMPWGLGSVGSDQFGGFLLALVIGVSAISASLPLGIILALGRRSDMLLIKTLSVCFIEFVRGVPLITMLFTASLLLQYFLPPQTNFDLILRVVILVTLFAAAYIAEVVRGGLAALPRGQFEAADALGLDYWQAQRLIVMPQALKISIPGIVSSFIGLFKDTTLVAFVGLADPLIGISKIARADINWKGIYWEPYLFVAVIFFIFCFGMSRYSMYLENKLKTDHR